MDNCWRPELGVYFLPLEGLKHQFPKASYQRSEPWTRRNRIGVDS